MPPENIRGQWPENRQLISASFCQPLDLGTHNSKDSVGFTIMQKHAVGLPDPQTVKKLLITLSRGEHAAMNTPVILYGRADNEETADKSEQGRSMQP